MNLFIDIETTGLINEDLALDDKRQPFPVEVAGLLTRLDGEAISSFHTVIRPQGWVITEETSRIHGISQDYADAYGISLQDAFAVLRIFAARVGRVLAYNMTFDGGIIEAACQRLGLESPLVGKPLVCVMRIVSDHFNCGRRTQRSIYKQLFDKPIAEAHSAMSDCRACRDIYVAIMPKAA